MKAVKNSSLKKIESMKEYLNKIINILSRETLKPERLKKYNSLLAYSKLK